MSLLLLFNSGAASGGDASASTSPYEPLQTILPCYPYMEYADDPNIVAFFTAINELSQPYLDFFNSTPLSAYTNPGIAGPLLDWIGQGIYGIARPVFSTQQTNFTAGLNTSALNTVALNAGTLLRTGTSVTANDDYYKRILTWWLYAGNGGNGGAVGRYFNVEVLRLKVARFLYGVNGTDVTLSQAQTVNIQPQALPPPPLPTILVRSSGTLPAHTYGVYTTYVSPIGETLGSPLAARSTTANQLITVASPPPANGAIAYNVYANYLTTNTHYKNSALNRLPLNTVALNGNSLIPSSPQTKQNATPIPIGTQWLEPSTGLIVGSPLPSTNNSNVPGNFIISVPAGLASTYFQEAMNQGLLAFPFLFSVSVVIH